MIPTYAGNAIMTKVRALYGKRLKADDYEQLLAKKTVSEAAAYLKNETYYAESLTEVNEELVHRKQLENLIRRGTFNVLYQRLRGYTSSRDSLFLQLFIMKNETEQLLTAIRLLNSGSMDKYIAAMPIRLARLMSFDLFQLARVTTFDGLLDVLEHSAYYPILARFRPSSASRLVDLTLCEAALLTRYYETALAHARHSYRGQTRKDLEELLYHQVTLHNISVIYRMRRYLGANREMIAQRVVRVSGANNKWIDRLLEAEDLETLQQLLSGNRLLRQSSFAWDVDVQRMAMQRMELSQPLHKHLFRFSTQPVVVVICYMTLLEIEQNNIIHIIEGIRYGVPPEELRRLVCW